jgi:hypothetical protein
MNFQGDKRPADVIVNAVGAMQVAMGESKNQVIWRLHERALAS